MAAIAQGPSISRSGPCTRADGPTFPEDREADVQSVPDRSQRPAPPASPVGRRPKTRAPYEPTGCRSDPPVRSEEPTSELQSLMRTPYAVFCLIKKNKKTI